VTVRELRQKLGELTNKLRAVLDKADGESRALTTEEDSSYNAIEADITTTENEITRREALEARESRMQETLNEHRASNPTNPNPEPGNADAEQRAVTAYCEEFRNFCISGQYGPALQQRALQADVGTAGGYVVPPEEFVAGLIQSLDDSVHVRALATTMQLTSAASLGQASLDADPADADWTSELGTGSEDSTMAFGKRELSPHPVAKRIKVSSKLMRQSPLGVEALVRNRLGYKFGVTHEKAFLLGTGSNQPLGLFIASADGVSSGRDMATDNTSTAITGDGLINALYSLKGQYQARATWGFHRDAIRNIRKLKGVDNDYIWQPGLSGGEPGVILTRPFFMSEYVPNTFTTGLYVGIVGDFSFYHIVDALDMTLQRLVELYAEANQVGFIGRMETDAMPVLEEAFARVTLA